MSDFVADPRAAERKRRCDLLTAALAGVAPKLLRPVAGILKHESISPTVPGYEYATELWDWDTYWTTRGLIRLAARLRDAGLRDRICRHARGSLFNFFDHQAPDGRIPLMMSEANPDVFGCLRPGRFERNQAKPVFAQLALLVSDTQGGVEWFRPRFEPLLRFYESWFAHFRSSIGLLVWGNDVTIGVDNDPTTFGRPFFSSANVLINCLFYQELGAAAELARRLELGAARERLDAERRELGENIQKYCWDPRDEFYYTVDVQCRDKRAELVPHYPPGMPMNWKCVPIRIQMFTGFFPLLSGLADANQAERLRRHYLDPRSFCAAYGVRTLSARESMFSLAFSSNPSNWLGPVWGLSNYVVWAGLKRYGFKAEADELADRTLALLSADVAASGTLHEYYHPDEGIPLSHPGFMDWNLLIFEMME